MLFRVFSRGTDRSAASGALAKSSCAAQKRPGSAGIAGEIAAQNQAALSPTAAGGAVSAGGTIRRGAGAATGGVLLRKCSSAVI
jgi:hypothetical protein